MARKSRKHLNNQIQVDYSTNNEPKTYKVGTYLRISVENHETIENQRQILNEFLSQHSEFTPCKEYVDDGRSSFRERDAFNRLITDAQSREIDCILVKDACATLTQ